MLASKDDSWKSLSVVGVFRTAEDELFDSVEPPSLGERKDAVLPPCKAVLERGDRRPDKEALCGGCDNPCVSNSKMPWFGVLSSIMWVQSWIPHVVAVGCFFFATSKAWIPSAKLLHKCDFPEEMGPTTATGANFNSDGSELKKPIASGVTLISPV